jgi:hypothetical protein
VGRYLGRLRLLRVPRVLGVGPVKLDRRVWWLVLPTLVFAAGLWRVEDTANEAQDAAAAVEQETTDRADQTCVNTWTVRQDIRGAIERATRAGGEALIAVVGSDTTPDVIAAFRAQLAAQAEAATTEIPDPECDLDAARERLEE